MDETTIIVAVVCLLVGLGVGALLTRTLSPQEKKRRELEARIQVKEDELNLYRQDVSDHLLKTSEMIRELNRSQRQIGEQLAKSALRLSSPDVSRQVQDAALDGLSREAGTSILSSIPQEAPKDYAPGRGILSENYGLVDIEDPGVTRGLATGPDAKTKESEEDIDPTHRMS